MNPRPVSRKGKPNKATADVRAAIAEFASANVGRMDAWLTTIAEGDPERDIKADPGRALDLYLRAIEYHIPKQARVEHTGADGGPVQMSLTVKGI